MQYPRVIYQPVTVRLNRRVDKYETRRLALIALITSIGRGGITKVAKRIGKEPNYVARMCYPPGKKGGKRIGEDSAEAIDRAFPGWLAPTEPDTSGICCDLPPGVTTIGIAEPERTANGSRHVVEWSRPEDLPHGQYAFVRRMRVRVSAGNGQIVFEEEEEDPLAFTTRWIKSRGLNCAHLVIVSATGDSMEPTIRDGSLLLIDRAQTSPQEGKVFAIRYGDEMRVKRIYSRYDGGLILRSDNRSQYPDQEIPAADLRHIEIVGRIVWSAGEM